MSARAGDVYFSREDGLAESRAVFVAGAGFPERFRPDLTVVGELGFGTGLNFLALWEAFRRDAPASARLHVVSVEGFPLRREDAWRALAAFPEIAPLADALTAVWPSPHLGPHRRIFDAGRVTLTVFHDEAEAALAQMAFRADAWFLDGFAPAKNPDMWTPALFAALARLSRRGAPAATFTVAGLVRRGLAEAGFTVDKRPGFGRKRERLEAVFTGAERDERPSPFPLAAPISGPVAVIGGGIAAAALVAAFARRRQAPDVFAEGGWGVGASGAPLGLLTPRLEAADRPHNRALLAAFDHARALFDGLDGFEGGGVLRLAGEGGGRLDRLAAMLDEDFEALDARAASARLGLASAGGLWMARAGRFAPRRLLTALTGGFLPETRRVAGVQAGAAGARLVFADGCLSRDYAAVILAGGWASAGLAPDLPLAPTAGRVAVFASATRLAAPVAWGGYAAPLAAGRVLVGATHERGPEPGAPDVAEAALRTLAAEGLDALDLGARIEDWGGVRAAAPDRLPVVGAVPGADFAGRWGAAARGGAWPEGEVESAGPVLVLGGLGARGFAHAPLLAEHLVSALGGEPVPLERQGSEALHPARFAWRALRRS